jgi:hypothetical protein
MQLGNGTGDATAAEDFWGRRLLLILLAIALVAAGLFFAAPPAGAENGAQYLSCGEEGEIEYINGDGEDDCTNFQFSNEVWMAVFDCPTCESADITVRTPMGDDIADIEIDQYPNDAPFTLIVTFDKGEGPAPGKARVDKDGEDMDRCRGNHDTDCVKVIRISGARTQYTVKIDEDPRFKFR